MENVQIRLLAEPTATLNECQRHLKANLPVGHWGFAFTDNTHVWLGQ